MRPIALSVVLTTVACGGRTLPLDPSEDAERGGRASADASGGATGTGLKDSTPSRQPTLADEELLGLCWELCERTGCDSVDVSCAGMCDLNALTANDRCRAQTEDVFRCAEELPGECLDLSRVALSCGGAQSALEACLGGSPNSWEPDDSVDVSGVDWGSDECIATDWLSETACSAQVLCGGPLEGVECEIYSGHDLRCTCVLAGTTREFDYQEADAEERFWDFCVGAWVPCAPLE